MRKLVLICGVLALGACSGAEEAPVEEVVEEEPVVEVASVVGTYVGTDDDGSEWTGIINEDGTTTIEVGGETVDSGTWRSAEDGTTCFTMTAEEGEEPTENCLTFGEVGEDGTVEVISADGESNMMTKVS